jgi:nitrogen fixation NifU-like protein
MLNLIKQFSLMIKQGAIPEHEFLEVAVSLSGVHQLRGRHNCALMGWQALTKSLRIYETQTQKMRN